jgi:hypothetical protein
MRLGRLIDSVISGEGLVIGCCECGDEPSGSGAPLVKYSVTCRL